MKASIFLVTKVNDPFSEYRTVATGPSGEEPDKSERIMSALEKLDVTEKGAPQAVFSEVGGKPSLGVYRKLEEVFPEGDEGREWAWEISTGGGRGRPTSYFMAYTFDEGTKALPPIDVIHKQAETDVRRLLKEAYKKSGSGEKAWILGAQPQVTFEPPASDIGEAWEHQGVWKEQMALREAARAKGEFLDPFIVVGETIHPIPGLEQKKKSEIPVPLFEETQGRLRSAPPEPPHILPKPATLHPQESVNGIEGAAKRFTLNSRAGIATAIGATILLLGAGFMIAKHMTHNQKPERTQDRAR